MLLFLIKDKAIFIGIFYDYSIIYYSIIKAFNRVISL